MQSRKWTNHPKFAIETALAGGLALGGAAAWPLVAPAQQSGSNSRSRTHRLASRCFSSCQTE
jgi:hypothetical protein